MAQNQIGTVTVYGGIAFGKPIKEGWTRVECMTSEGMALKMSSPITSQYEKMDWQDFPSSAKAAVCGISSNQVLVI